jgi:hypothetical protein
VCTENLIRIDCVTEFPNVNGNDCSNGTDTDISASMRCP